MTDEEKIQLILDESKKIQSEAIKIFLKEYGKFHNVPDEHNYFDAKQEVVARSAYFPGIKKKYALYLVHEGKSRVDKRDDKGLVVRRSDYSFFTKECIKKLLKMLVEADVVSFTEIREFIDETREKIAKLISEGSKEIARPVTFAKKLEDYKVIPIQIKGMELFNQLEYNYFETGTRGYMFRIKGVDFLTAPEYIRKNLQNVKVGNNVVIPYEEEKLPPYYILDHQAMIDFAWNDRVNELIDPIKEKLGYFEIKEEELFMRR